MRDHAVGDRVMIYQDPVTEEKQEGQAKLVELIHPDLGKYESRTMQTWWVQFNDNPEHNFRRQLLTPRE